MVNYKKYLILLALFIFIAIGCKNKRQANTAISSVSDTIIGSKQLTEEIAGSAYRKRATEYFVIINNDTVDFTPVFTESKKDGQIGVIIRFENMLTYRGYLDHLKLILPEAAKDYNFDSLTGVYIGRLYSTGDLAISISNQYLKTFGAFDNIRTSDYKRVQQFLLESRLADDFNTLFRPYSLSVEKVVIEKAFFTTKDELLRNCRIETDTSLILEKILDCMTGIQLKKINAPF